MNSKNNYLYALGLMALIAVNSPQADIVKPDDLIVQGRMCTGQDCTSGIDFQNNTMILRENNLKIRFIDSSASDVLGQSWSLSANDVFNNGKSYFQIEARSLSRDSVSISSGNVPMFDCSVSTIDTLTLPPIIGTIPFGSPIQAPVNPLPDGGGMFLWSCETSMDYTIKSLVSLGTVAENNVSLGIDSEPVANAISIGNPGLLRKLKHVADGISDSNLLVTKMLSGYSLLGDQRLQVDFLTSQLALLEEQIEDIEKEVFPDSKSSGSGSFGAGLMIFLLVLRLFYIARVEAHSFRNACLLQKV